jgi:hypothetical protein
MTGAHAIIFQIVLADLVCFLIWLLIGSVIGPPIWWSIRLFLRIFHVSLALDLWGIAVFVAYWIGRYRRRSLYMPEERAWGGVSLFIVLATAMLLVIFLVKTAWIIALPASAVPVFPLEPVTLRLVFVPQGAGVAAILSLLAHLYVLRKARISTSTQQLALSQAHPDGPIWSLIEQAYAIYRRGLARFDPPPISHLVTPATFFYYQKQITPESNEPVNPEQEISWRDGSLVINRAYIGTKQEQSDILLPFLARQLYDCNTPDHTVEQLFTMATVAEATWLPSWILALPAYVAGKCKKQWETMERERVLDRDWFAYACGQALLLRNELSTQLRARTRDGLPDNTIPTLAERIDHLDSLLTREKRQVQRLKDMLPSPPDKAP